MNYLVHLFKTLLLLDKIQDAIYANGHNYLLTPKHKRYHDPIGVVFFIHFVLIHSIIHSIFLK